MTIKHGLLPCLVRGMDGGFSERALFHCWGFKAWTHGDGLMIGSFPAGQEAYVFAIVEREGGEVTVASRRTSLRR